MVIIVMNIHNHDTDLDDKKIKQEIITTLRNLYKRNLITALSGNISVRIPNTNYIWITPTSIHKAKIRTDDLVKIDFNGNILEGYNKPSIEWQFHIAIYKVRPDINAIVHTHNLNVLILNSLDVNLSLDFLMESKYYVKEIAYIPEVEPGSKELAKMIADKASMNVNVIILKKHGIVTLGKNLFEAEALAEILENLAIVQLYSLVISTLKRCIKNMEIG